MNLSSCAWTSPPAKTQRREDAPEWRFEGKILARDAGGLHRLYERPTPALGAREAALAVLGAMGVLVHPGARGRAAVTSGEWILDELGILLFGDKGEHGEDESDGGGDG